MSAAADIFESKPVNAGEGKPLVIHVCECGKAHRLFVAHYDRVLLKCGRMVWALQPKRNGPLAMFPWPGPPMTARELAAKESGERDENWAAGRWTA